MKLEYEIITSTEFDELMAIFDGEYRVFNESQIGCFIIEPTGPNDDYIAIDNSSANMWTEEFCTLGLCVDYFNGENLNELHAANRFFKAFRKVLSLS